jgi:hypothetical protein
MGQNQEVVECRIQVEVGSLLVVEALEDLLLM